MKRMVIIFILNLIVVLYYVLQGRIHIEPFLMITGPFLAFMLIGIILLNNNPLNKAGKICYTIGMVIGLPLSLVGYFGMKQYIRDAEDDSIYNKYE